jgi:hypothetical protein
MIIPFPVPFVTIGVEVGEFNTKNTGEDEVPPSILIFAPLDRYN